METTLRGKVYYSFPYKYIKLNGMTLVPSVKLEDCFVAM